MIMGQAGAASTRRDDDHRLIGAGARADRWREVYRARMLRNGGRSKVGEIPENRAEFNATDRFAAVRTSQIAALGLFDFGEVRFPRATDGRIAFATPYERGFALIGVTARPHRGEVRTR